MNGQETITPKEFITEKFVNLEKTTELARSSMEKRLDGMNEFRDTLKDQASRFVTRSELETIVEKIGSEIKLLNKSKDILEGKASQLSVNITLTVSIVSVLIAIIALIHKL